jgi:hypothetical protein
MIEQSIRDNIKSQVHAYIDSYEDDGDDNFTRIFGAQRDDNEAEIESDRKSANENAEVIVNSQKFQRDFCGFWNNEEKTSNLKDLADLVEKLLLGSSVGVTLQGAVITVLGISFPVLLAAPVIWYIVMIISKKGVESYCKGISK